MEIQEIQDILNKGFDTIHKVLPDDRQNILTKILINEAKVLRSKNNDISLFFSICRSIIKQEKAKIDQAITDYRAQIDQAITDYIVSDKKDDFLMPFDCDADLPGRIYFLEQEKNSLSMFSYQSQCPVFDIPDYVYLFGGDLILKSIDEAEAELIASTIKPTEENKQTFADLLKCDASKKKAIIDYMKAELENTKKPNKTTAFLILALISISYLNQITNVSAFYKNLLKGTFRKVGTLNAFNGHYKNYLNNKELQKETDYLRYVEEIKKLA